MLNCISIHACTYNDNNYRSQKYLPLWITAGSDPRWSTAGILLSIFQVIIKNTQVQDNVCAAPRLVRAASFCTQL